LKTLVKKKKINPTPINSQSKNPDRPSVKFRKRKGKPRLRGRGISVVGRRVPKGHPQKKKRKKNIRKGGGKGDWEKEVTNTGKEGRAKKNLSRKEGN